MVLAVTALLLAGCSDYGIQDTDASAGEFEAVEERFVQAALPKVDVLFVVDSTGSMEDEQLALGDAAEAFIDALEAFDLSYQLGVTTTDPADDGELLGRPWIVTGANEDPAAALADALDVGSGSPPPAAGFYAAELALDDAAGTNRGFRRRDASLHVVFVSDGDDESDTWLADPAADFVAFLAAEATRTGRSARASAVVGDVPDGCRGTSGEAQPGTRYASVAEGSGGIVASICETDFVEVAAALGGAGVEFPTRFPLSEEPVDGSVRVEIDGERVDEGWSVDFAEPALVFDTAPAADAEIHVVYNTAVEEP